MRVVHFV
jgi:hypothetical protein